MSPTPELPEPSSTPTDPTRAARFMALARDLATRMAPEVDAADRSSSFAAHNHRLLALSGYPGLVVPQRFGGQGASLYEFVQAQTVLGSGDAATALTAAMTAHLIGGASEAGSWPPSLLERVCQEVAGRGALLNAVASEPELGSPSRGGRPRTFAERVPAQGEQGAGWRLSGRKTWASGAPALSYFVVSAAMGEHDGVARFVVPAGAPGLRLEPSWHDTLALRSSGAHDVVFEAVFVPDEAVIPPAAPQPSGSAWFWSAVAATYLGVGYAARDALCAYALERVPSALGRPIATLPALRQTVGRIEVALSSARALLLEHTRRWSEQPEARPELLPRLGACKVRCVGAALEATDLALRAAGGAALTRALPLERLFRDARAGLAHPPAEDSALEALGAALLERDPGASRLF